ncbi:MAG: sigma 54-interacting transcriptional regulator [Deltaproteobacteria bacterium]|nr:sigma 54-interacting transcriptional regulator [Deltaproteobacteria bacterium]
MSTSVVPPLARAESPEVFGGRQTEGEALLKAHERALSTGGGVLLLSGPRGVGKGALLAGLRQSILRAGRGPVFHGSARGQHRPYAALADALRDALGHLDTLGTGHELRVRHHGALAVMDPALTARPDATALPPSRLGFHEATLALCRDVLARSGATLVLADLQDGTEDTLAVCRYLALHLPDPRAALRGALVVSLTEDGRGGALADELGALLHVERVRVGGLDRDGLVRFLRGSTAVDRLLAASGGRPTDVDELLQALPLDVGALLGARLDRLGERARAVAEALCTCDAPLGVDAISAMTSTPPHALAAPLGALTEEGLVTRRVANGALLFTLARPTHAERLRAALPPDRAARLHHALAVHLEAKGAALMEGGDQHLAEHFLAAGNAESGVAYALSATERLTVAHAWGAAIELLDRALPLAARTPERLAILGRRSELYQLRGDLVPALADAGRARALLPAAERGPAWRRLGELLSETGRPRLAVRALDRALALAAGAPDAAEPGLCEAALADALYVAGDRDAARARARAALARTGLSELHRIRVRNTLGKLSLAAEEWEQARALFTENRDAAARTALPAEVTRSEINLGVLAFRRGQYDQAEAHLGRALRLAEENADLPNQAFCVLNLGSLRHQRRDLAQALRLHHESLALFTRIGNRAEMARARLNVANLSLVLGDHDQAEDHLGRAGELLSLSGLSTQQAYLAALRGDLALSRGQPAAAREAYQGARRLYAEAGQRGRVAEQWLRLAQAALRAGDPSSVDEALGHLGAQRAELDHPRLRVEARVAEARAMLLATPSAEAATRAAALVDDARAQLPEPADPEVLALIAYTEGELWAARGDSRRAEKLGAVARDHLHRAAADLPPALRDGYVRSRAALLGPAAPVAARPSVDTASTPPVETGATEPPVPASRPEPWTVRYGAMVGSSPALFRLFSRLDRLAGSTSTVLIRGESGTGKELVANALHAQSPRASAPLVKVNCGALVETLLLSELFGHEKGAFTGAHQRKVGRFELARGGTIFLDEIGDISPKTQVSLLRVLQERVFERVGGGVTLRADCRVICATHRDLEAMVKAGSFREDLYYRLKGVVVETPALRDRRADIPELIDHVARAAAAEMDRPAPAFSAAALEALARHDWPGNIRELENAIRSLVLFAENGAVDVEHLAELGLRSPRRASANSDHATAPEAIGAGLPPGGIALGQMKKKLEFEAISRALEDGRGNISRAAELLHMKRPRLSQIVNGNAALRAIKERWRAVAAEDGGEA